MPELPEVETIVRDLARHLTGEKIKSCRALFAKALKPGPAAWRRVAGQRINKVWRRGKQLVFDLSGGEHIVIHLKMTGQLIWRSAVAGRHGKIVAGGHPIVGVGQELPNKFTRVIFSFTDGSELFFNDVRKFGWLKLVKADDLAAAFGSLGIEPLTRQFTGAKLQELLSVKAKSKIKPALMDQAKIAGIGNIYADEALWRARIRPDRRVAQIKAGGWLKLAAAIKQVLQFSIKHRGTSFSDYRDASGAKGNFINKLKVYGRGGQSCPRCGRPLSKAKLAGRGTHWCDKCQK